MRCTVQNVHAWAARLQMASALCGAILVVVVGRARSRRRRHQLYSRRVYWYGRHPRYGWGSVFCMHAEGMAVLERYGWRRARMEPESQCTVPIFALTNKRGSNFAAHGANSTDQPHVRQFPQDCTARLDDKLALMRLLTDANGDARASTRSFFPATCAADDSTAVEKLICAPRIGGFFVKHRWGAKGQSVRFCADARAVRTVLGNWTRHARQDAVV